MTPGPGKPVADEAPASVPQTTPTAIGYGHPEYQFVQAIMEMQKSIGELKASIDNVKNSNDSIKTKVDDLVGWKNKILGGAFVLGVLATAIGVVIGKFSDYVTIKSPTPQVQVQPIPDPPAKPQKKQ